jgi:hypothetical protein
VYGSLPANAGGVSTVCAGVSTPAFTNVLAGGTWSIVPGTGTASVSSNGVVTGLTSGTVSVKYTYSNGTCSNSVSSSLTVNPTTPTAISLTGASTFNYNRSPQGPETANVTGSSGAITYTYIGTGTTEYGPSNIKPTNLGTYGVYASVASDANGCYSAFNPELFDPGYWQVEGEFVDYGYYAYYSSWGGIFRQPITTEINETFLLRASISSGGGSSSKIIKFGENVIFSSIPTDLNNTNFKQLLTGIGGTIDLIFTFFDVCQNF